MNSDGVSYDESGTVTLGDLQDMYQVMLKEHGRPDHIVMNRQVYDKFVNFDTGIEEQSLFPDAEEWVDEL